jgi:hypothetical protein
MDALAQSWRGIHNNGPYTRETLPSKVPLPKRERASER